MTALHAPTLLHVREMVEREIAAMRKEMGTVRAGITRRSMEGGVIELRAFRDALDREIEGMAKDA